MTLKLRMYKPDVLTQLFTQNTEPRISPGFQAITPEVTYVGPHDLTNFNRQIIVIFSYDLEGNVTRLELMIFTMCKHTFEPT